MGSEDEWKIILSKSIDKYFKLIYAKFMDILLNLYLASVNIGALWFGIGKVEEDTYNGLDFVIMIAIAKVAGDKFRKDMFKSKRKPLEEIWSGDSYHEIGNIVRFAPSACNTQPWKVAVKEKFWGKYPYKRIYSPESIFVQKVVQKLLFLRIDT